MLIVLKDLDFIVCAIKIYAGNWCSSQLNVKSFIVNVCFTHGSYRLHNFHNLHSRCHFSF